jgi:hypothetical protein
VHCAICRTNRTKHQITQFRAAPKILRIHLTILLYENKMFHYLIYPSVLDLTQHQQNATLPLRYHLSSVIAHHGDYVDVGGSSSGEEDDDDDDDDEDSDEDEEESDEREDEDGLRLVR